MEMLHIKFNGKTIHRDVLEIKNRPWKYEVLYIETPWNIILQKTKFWCFLL